MFLETICMIRDIRTAVLPKRNLKKRAGIGPSVLGVSVWGAVMDVTHLIHTWQDYSVLCNISTGVVFVCGCCEVRSPVASIYRIVYVALLLKKMRTDKTEHNFYTCNA